MATVAESSLSQAERRTLDRLVAGLESELGEDLLAVWLFGSKARGEEAGPETDIDLLVVTRRGSSEDGVVVRQLAERSAEAEGTFHLAFRAIVHSPERVAERRAKDTFFLREVDQYKIVLAGSEGGEFGERIPFTKREPGESGGVRARSEDYLVEAREFLAAAKVLLDGDLPSRRSARRTTRCSRPPRRRSARRTCSRGPTQACGTASTSCSWSPGGSPRRAARASGTGRGGAAEGRL